MRILVIDDEELVRLTIRSSLEPRGHEVIEAENGLVGLRRFAEFEPDLVICDIIMPEKEGIETIAELRRNNPNLLILAISGGGRMKKLSYLEIAGQLGANDILPKPFGSHDILRKVEALSARGATSSA
jgi:CheY-like chemotaxis protein